jgi:hypothetical protein
LTFDYFSHTNQSVAWHPNFAIGFISERLTATAVLPDMQAPKVLKHSEELKMVKSFAAAAALALLTAASVAQAQDASSTTTTTTTPGIPVYNMRTGQQVGTTPATSQTTTRTTETSPTVTTPIVTTTPAPVFVQPQTQTTTVERTTTVQPQ